jgi:hypothetical protein
MKKDIERGTARLADGAKLFDPADDSHVQRSTPMMVKRREIENDPRYRTEAAPDTNKQREQRTTALLRRKDVRSL